MKRFIRRSIAIILVVTMLPFASFADAGAIKAYAAAPSLSQNATVQPGETTGTAAPGHAAGEGTANETAPEAGAIASQGAGEPVVIAEEEEITTHGGEEIDAFVNAYLKDPEGWEAEHPEVSIEDMKVNRSTTLTEDMFVKDLYLEGCFLNLNGYTLYVCGNLYQTSGTIRVWSGSVVVLGDYQVGENASLDMSGTTDYALVMGDFNYNSNIILGSSFNGSMEVKGDFIHTAKGDGTTFSVGDVFTLYLTGDTEQHLSMEKTGHDKSRLANLVLENNSEEGIVFENVPYVEGKITVNDTKLTGTLSIGGNASFSEEIYPGSIRMSYGVTLNAPLTIEGDLYVEDGAEPAFEDILAVKGNVVLNGPFHVSEGHRFVLSGESEQHVSLYNGASFGILELQNYSVEGVVVDTYASWEKLITNGCNITLPEVVQNSDHILQEDEIIPGDYVIEKGKLDLNGHTLTVQGNLIQSNGNINLSGGSLIVEGDFRRQSRTKNEEGGYEYGSCNGNIYMQNAVDYMLVKGDFYDNSNASSCAIFSAGCLELKGSYYQAEDANKNSFCAYGSHTVLLSGEGRQVISFKEDYIQNSYIYNLKITNISEEGVIFQGVPWVYGTCDSERDSRIQGCVYKTGSSNTYWGSFYNGDIAAWNNLSLRASYEIGGDLYVYDALQVYENLSVDGNIFMSDNPEYNYSNGYMSVYKNLTVKGNVMAESNRSYSGICMYSTSAYALIEGDYQLVAASTVYSNGGTMEIKGNVTFHSAVIDNGVILFSGDEKQVVSVSTGSSFNVLNIQNTSQEGVIFQSRIEYKVLTGNGNYSFFGKDVIGGHTLMEDETIEGDVVLTFGTMNLNGHTLHIMGDLIQLDGTMDINGGSLIVEGGYYIGNPDTMWDENAKDTSIGYLFMDDSNDYVLVKGDFLITWGKPYNYTDPNYSNRNIFTDGVLEVKGDFVQKERIERYSTGESSFPASGNHTVILSGEKGQTVWFAVSSQTGSHINNLKIENTSEDGITFKKDLHVVGTIYSNRAHHIKGCVALSSLEQINGDYYAGSIINSGTMTIDKEKEIGGDFIVTGGSSTSSNVIIKGAGLKVDGNLIIKGILELSEAQMEVLGDVSIAPPESAYDYYGIKMEHDGDHLLVHGDFSKRDNDSRFTKGTLEVKGDYTDTCIDTYGIGHRVLLSGTGLQTIDAKNITFGILELQNYSEAGVYSETLIKKNKLILNGCRLTIGDGSGIYGFTLTDDYIAAGDITLLDDTLDLNGHTLTVQGDLILQDGEVDINGGELIVEGNLRFQSRKLDEKNYTYSPGYGHLIMDGKEDLVTVKGNVIVQTGVSILGDMTAGTLRLKGNLQQIGTNDFVLGSTLLLSGGSKQSLQSEGKIELKDCIIENRSEEGIEFVDDVTVTGQIEDAQGKAAGPGNIMITDTSQIVNGLFGGNVLLNEKCTVAGEIEIRGTLTVTGTVNLGNSMIRVGNLIVDNTLHTDDATVIIENDLDVTVRGLFTMMGDSYVLIKGNASFATAGNTNGYLTKGTLEIQGNFEQKGNYQNFWATGEHYTIFRRKNVIGPDVTQTMTVYSNTRVRFRYLELTADGAYSMGYAPEKIADEVIYIHPDLRIPAPIKEIRAEQVTVTSVTLVYEGDYEEDEVKGYAIYRDGEKIAVTTANTYTDTGLTPGGSYTYQVYPYNIDKNGPSESPSCPVTLPEDTEAPTVPENLTVKMRTGSAITLSWDKSKDNVATTGYRLYRDNVLIYEGAEPEYKDSGLTENTLYTYAVEAFDAAGNVSERSQGVDGVVLMPKILSVTPEDYAIVGGDTVEITVQLDDSGNSGEFTVQMEYFDPDSEIWEVITEGVRAGKSRGNLYATCKWDITRLTKSEDIDILISVTDRDGNTTEQTITYTLDRNAPEAPENVKAEDDGGTVVISWDISKSADCVGYEIYRLDMDGDEAGLLTVISGRNSSWYRDSEVEDNKNYRYYIKSFDAFEQKSPMSNIADVFISADTQAPRVVSMTPDSGKINGEAKLTVTGKDNRAVAEFELFIRRNAEEEWAHLDLIEAEENTGTYVWNTTEYEDATYFIKVVARDKNGNENADLFMRRYEVDNTGIAKIRFLDPVVSSTSIGLKWEDVTEDDFGWFLIEEKTGEDWKEIGRTSNQLGYYAQNLKPDTTHTYRVVGYDAIGNRGIPSDPMTITTLSDTAAPVITAINPISSYYNNSIPLSMVVKDGGGVAYGKFSYSVSENGIEEDEREFIEIGVVEGKGATEETLSLTWDISALPEGTVIVRFEAWDTAGLHNALYEDAQIENIYIIDRQPPEQVIGGHVENNEGCIRLEWDRVSDEDVNGYIVERALEGESIFKSIGTVGNTTAFTDRSVKQGVIYIYRISAVDIAGNQGEPSEEIYAMVQPDKTAPVVLGISPSDRIVGKYDTVKVLATDNADLNSIIVEYREADSLAPWQEIAKLDASGREQYQEIAWDKENLKENTVYEVRAKAIDAAGNESDYVVRQYELDMTAPKAPELTTQTGSYRIELSYTENEEEDFQCYKIYRREYGQTEYTCIQATIQNTFTDEVEKTDTMYYYKVRAYDIYGNYSESNIEYNYANHVDKIAPAAYLPETMYSYTGMEIGFDGTLSSDNLRINRYEWDFGDGTTATGVRPVHIYEKSGIYTVKLTVWDGAGNQGFTSMTVQIMDKANSGMSIIRVTSEEGAPLSGAYVYVKTGSDSQDYVQLRTDSNGEVKLINIAGIYEYATYAANYLPAEGTVRVSNYETLEEVSVLKKGDVVVGSLTVERMELEELIERGVDLTAPENYHTFKFKAEFWFAGAPFPEVYETLVVGTYEKQTRNTDSSSGSGKLSNIKGTLDVEVITPKEVEDEDKMPTIAYLQTTQSISWLKDMYDVQLGIINQADSSFVITDSVATVNLPKGMSLAETKSGQTMSTKMPDIVGQESASASWIVRGDETGSYSLSASFHGVLQPFGADIDAQFNTQMECEVKAGEGIVIYVSPENAYYPGEQYFVQFRIVNESNRNIYNLTTSLGEYMAASPVYEVFVKDRKTGGIFQQERFDEGITYHSATAAKSPMIPVLYDGDMIEVGVLAPGQTIYGTYCAPPELLTAAEDEIDYYVLIDHLITVLEGENTGVKVVVAPISSHVYKYVLNVDLEKLIRQAQKAADEETYGDPIDVTTGAFLHDLATISFNGGSNISFDMHYNSMLSEYKGEAGYGWSHYYEKWVEDIGSSITLHMTPYSETSFLHEDVMNMTVYGSIEGNTIFLDGVEDADLEEGTYYPTSSDLDGSYIEKNADGYQLTISDGSVYNFDKEGLLCHITTTDGKGTTISHSDGMMRITDDVTKDSLQISYDKDGFISGVSDNHGRNVSIEHMGGDLTAITGVTGGRSEYRYDGLHHLSAATNANGATYVENTYDEEGRVTSQKEAGKPGISRLSYHDRETGGVSIEITNQNGGVTVIETNEKGEKIKETAQDGFRLEYIYDKKGNLLDERDVYDNTVMYQYDEEENLIAVYDTAGNVTFMEYDTAGNVTAIKSQNGNQSFSTYDENNRLIRNVSPLGEVTRYAYDEEGNVIRMIKDGLGTTALTYENGLKTSQTDAMGNTASCTYDTMGNMTSYTDVLGNVTTYTYDAAGRVLTEKTSESLITHTYDAIGQEIKTSIRMTDGEERTVTYTYDAAGNITSQTDWTGRTVTYRYDSLSNLTETIYPDGSRESITYDALGNILSSTDVNGICTEYTYDLSRHVTSITTGDMVVYYEYYPNGKVYKTTDADGTKTYYYDSSWNCIRITDDAGSSVYYTYDAEGNKTSEIDPLGNTTKYVYDNHGRCIQIIDPNGNKTSYAYDGNGNVTRVTDALGNVTEFVYGKANLVTDTRRYTENGYVTAHYEYDNLGRMISQTDEEGNTYSISYDIFGNEKTITDAKGNVLVESTYDSLGQLVQETDILGNTTVYQYDVMGNLTAVTDCLNSTVETNISYAYDKGGRLVSVMDAAGSQTSVVYDKNGNIVSVTDAMDGTTTYSYDSMSRVTQVINAISAKETYTYNAQGLLAEAVDNAGRKTNYTYDKAGRIIQMKDELGTTKYTYDKNGNVLTVSDKNGTITRTYDALNRVTSVTDYQGNAISYGYDQLGNRISITYPGGEKVRYTYDKTGRLLTVTDQAGNITYYSYDENGNLTETRRGNGTRGVRTYDAANRLLTLTDQTAAGAVISEYAYTYDAAGNITEIKGMDTGISAESADALLKTQTTADGTIAISVSMTYDEDNRLLSYNNQQVEYDAVGNMTKGPLNGAMADFAYDCRNRLVKVTEADGTVTTYEYDAEDIRIASETGGIRTEYVTERESTYSQTLMRTDYEKSLLGISKKELAKTTYVYGIGLLSERRDDGKEYYYHYNHIGSTMAVSDGSGKVAYRFAYDTYGELSDIKNGDGISLKILEEAGDYTLEELAHGAGLTYLYNGQFGVATDKNGLYYMRARYYDQDIKRFINRDIVSGDITNSKSLNRYAYVQGNPVSLVDPFGLCPDGNSAEALFNSIRNFFCNTDWNAVGHKLLDYVGYLFPGANLLNAAWYYAEGNPEMAEISMLRNVPGLNILFMIQDVKYIMDNYSDVGHAVLDVVGIFWDGADLINAAWYLYEENYEMAAMSLVCALPFIGNCVGGTVGLAIKFAGYGLTAFKGAVGTREAIDRAIEDYHNGTLSWINALDIGLNAVTFVVGTTAFYKTGAELVRSEAGQKFLRNVAQGIKNFHADNGGYVNLDAFKFGNNARKVNTPPSSVLRQVKKLSPEAKDGYERAIQALENGDVRGLNAHPLGNNRSGQWAVDIKGTGQRRGAGRLIYEYVGSDEINIIEIILNHKY